MFSGIVETISEITAIEKHPNFWTCQIHRPQSFNDLEIGESIAINGACLTITHVNTNYIQFDLINETLHRTNLSKMTIGAYVNMERSLATTSRIHGHMVQGHIDCSTKIISIERNCKTRIISFSMPQKYQHQIIEKGYIAIDGMSLTIASLDEASFAVALIPHTLQHTIAQHYQISSEVNIETDIVGKYLSRYLELRHE